jgi:UTP-glucose-1-phosphate uridylyltransferase
MTQALNKVVILLGFAGPGRGTERGAVQSAVEEALAAGLSELIFVTPDSTASLEGHLGSLDLTRPSHVVVARQNVAMGLGQMLCGVRHLIDGQAFMVLLPGGPQRRDGGSATARLLTAYTRLGGSLVSVRDDEVLRRDGTFAAIASAATGHYLLQPAVLDVLAADPDCGLAEAILATAEAWPVTAIPLQTGRFAGKLAATLPEPHKAQGFVRDGSAWLRETSRSSE